MTTKSNTNNQGCLPSGLAFAPEIISVEEEIELIRLIEACGPQRYLGHEQSLLAAISYGWRYDMGDGHFSPCEPMPACFLRVRNLAALFANIDPESIVQCLFNRYEIGADIPWHIDKPVWEHVIGISLGSATSMGFRTGADGNYQYASLNLPPRSIYAMTGEARHAFAHSIPAVSARRWSITFRTFSAEGEKMLDARC